MTEDSKREKERIRELVDEVLARKISRQDSISFWEVKVPQSEKSVRLPKSVNDHYVSLLTDKEYRCNDSQDDVDYCPSKL